MRVSLALACSLLALLCLRGAASARCLTVPSRGRGDDEIQVSPETRVEVHADCTFGLGASAPERVTLPAAPRTMSAIELLRAVSERAGRAVESVAEVHAWDEHGRRREAISLRRYFADCAAVSLIEVSWADPPSRSNHPPTVRVAGPPRAAAACAQVRLRDPTSTRAPIALSRQQWTDVASMDAMGAPTRYRVEVSATPPSASTVWVDVGPLDLWGRATPMQRFFASHQEIVTLRTEWTTGSMRLEPVGAWIAQPRLFDELLVAASAQELWLARDRIVVANLEAQLDAAPRRVRLPDAAVDAWMTRRYGPAGLALAPTFGDWQGILEGLSLCHIREYQRAAPSPGDVIPPDARCVPIRTLVELPPDVIGRGARSYRVTLEHRVRSIRRAATEALGALDQRAATLSLPESPDRETWPFVVVRGDRVRLGVPGARPWSRCVNGQCAPLDRVEGMELVDEVNHAGLVEIRPGRRRGAATRQGLVLLRFIVIDPQRDWTPVGLTRGGDRRAPWDAVSWDEEGTAGFARRSQRMAFSLSLDPTSVAAWNRRALPPQSAAAVSVLSGDLGPLTARVHPPGETGTPAVAVLVDRASSCPTATARALRTAVPPDPTALPVDTIFHVHLVQVLGDDLPVRCLAQSRFRVRPERLIGSRWPVQLGALGELRAALTVTGPVAIGLVLPVVYTRLHLPGGVAVETSLGLSTFVAFDGARVHRAGLTSSLDMSWGPPPTPRLIAVGLLCDLWTHDATDLRPPGCAVHLSLSLGALYDAVGAR